MGGRYVPAGPCVGLLRLGVERRQWVRKARNIDFSSRRNSVAVWRVRRPVPKLRTRSHQICCSWVVPWARLVQSIGDLRGFWAATLNLIGVLPLKDESLCEAVACVVRSGTAYNHLIDTKPSLR